MQPSRQRLKGCVKSVFYSFVNEYLAKVLLYFTIYTIILSFIKNIIGVENFNSFFLGFLYVLRLIKPRGYIMKKPISIKKFLRYFFSLACYFLLSNLDGKYSPFSLALLTSNLIVGLKPLTSFLLYLTPYLLSFSPRVILYSACGGGAVTIAFFLYKKYKKNPSFELVGILAVALIPFALLSPVAITLKITVSASII